MSIKKDYQGKQIYGSFEAKNKNGQKQLFEITNFYNYYEFVNYYNQEKHSDKLFEIPIFVSECRIPINENCFSEMNFSINTINKEKLIFEKTELPHIVKLAFDHIHFQISK